MRLKFTEIIKTKKRKLNKWVLGMRILSFKNKNNNQLNSTFLTIFAVFSIITLLITMLAGVTLFSVLFYLKTSSPEKTIFTQTSNPSLVLPSVNKNSIEEVKQEVLGTIEQNKSPESIKRRYIVWIPIVLFLPIIFLTTFFHEIGHYLLCRRAGVRIKEYGLGVLSIIGIPLIPFAFVEPMKKDFNKTSKFNYFSIVSAGVAMNIFIAIISFFMFFLIQNSFIELLFIFNLGIALTNALPVLILDGGLVVTKISKRLNYITSILVLFAIISLAI